MGKKRGVWGQDTRDLATDLTIEELRMGDELSLSDGVDPYESTGAVAATRLPERESPRESRGAAGCNPYEHGSFAPERAWDGAGLDTRDIDSKKSTWLGSRLGPEATADKAGGGFWRRRR